MSWARAAEQAAAFLYLNPSACLGLGVRTVDQAYRLMRDGVVPAATDWASLVPGAEFDDHALLASAGPLADVSGLDRDVRAIAEPEGGGTVAHNLLADVTEAGPYSPATATWASSEPARIAPTSVRSGDTVSFLCEDGRAFDARAIAVDYASGTVSTARPHGVVRGTRAVALGIRVADRRRVAAAYAAAAAGTGGASA